MSFDVFLQRFAGGESADVDRRRVLRKAFKRALVKAKLDTRYRLHDLRAQFAVMLLEAGTDLETVRKALRHKDIATTARYLRFVKGRVGEAVRSLRLPTVDTGGAQDAKVADGQSGPR